MDDKLCPLMKTKCVEHCGLFIQGFGGKPGLCSIKQIAEKIHWINYNLDKKNNG